MYKAGKCLLRDRLRDAGMTQQQLSNKSGVNKSSISSYANNERKMSLDTAKTITDALGCSVDDLYEWERFKSRR